MWRDALKFFLHPLIQIHLRHKQESKQRGDEGVLQVADLATGTGIWLFDLVKSPEVNGLNIQFHGLDISNSLFPHSTWLPKNVSLSTSNLLKEPPESLHGKFDVVHVRLVLSLIGSGSPKPIMRHIKMLLKPGGYLQWDELDPRNHYDVLTPKPDEKAPNMTSTFERVGTIADWSWIAKLPETLREEGFEEASQSPHEPNPEMFKAWTYMDLCLAEELSYNLQRKYDDGEHGEKWRGLIPKAYDEADEAIGAVLRVRPTVTIARKPLD
ncbi:hypothetical protein RRF57_008851 [Xylaria bambusicola]|uniref:Methyltransferase type 12 domain-containing protein n=1 Tax=Xylaria bambusicola TaxID=326684 RepID=A0AAN7Z7D4_9PEZI